MVTTRSERKGPAQRLRGIAPFHVMDVLARAKELEARGRRIIHMEIGEPDFATAEPIVEAGIRALRAGHTHYTPARGIPELRAAIARHYRDRFGVEVDPDRILVTPGASGALQLVMCALLDADDEVLLTDPCYPCNRQFVRLAGGRAVGVPVDAASGYQLTPDLVAARGGEAPAGVLLASPANPTGTVVPPAQMAAILERCEALGARLIVDEIYQGLVYGDEPATALAISDEVFVVNSFSKYFGMTGWRLGWVVAPQAFVRELEKLAQNLFISASTIAQHAALAAFEPATLEILESRREAFAARRDFLLPALRELGFEIPVQPRGAFYLYADCGQLAEDSQRLALEVLERTGVAITPGLDFGEHAARRHVRFAYTTGMEQLEEAVQRLRGYPG